MSKRKVFHHLLGVFFAIAAVFLCAPDAPAVVKNVNLVATNGRPLKNESVTIEKADGTVVGERTTDDKGILKFNFPEAGEYVVKDSKGNALKKLEVTRVGMATWVLAELGLGAAVLVASNDNIFGSKVTSSGGTGGGPGVSPVNGNYNLVFLVASGETPGGPLDLLSGSSITVNITTQPLLKITQTTTVANFADMTGALNNITFDFNATGTGTYNNTPAEFSMRGTFNVSAQQNSTVSGTYSITLPNNQVVTYNFDGTPF